MFVWVERGGQEKRAQLPRWNNRCFDASVTDRDVPFHLNRVLLIESEADDVFKTAAVKKQITFSFFFINDWVWSIQ